MALPIKVEIAVPEEVSKTETGNILESFSRKLLESQNYKVEDQVRITGMEVDLFAKNRTTDEIVYVECKGHRKTIAAEVVFKLCGQVAFNKAASGWLISTSDLGKDAKGLKVAWSEWPAEEKRKLHFYDPTALVDILVSANLVISADKIVHAHDINAKYALLVLTEDGEYWAIVDKNQQNSSQESVQLFEAGTGEPVGSRALYEYLQATNCTLADSKWVMPKVVEAPEKTTFAQVAQDSSIRNQIQAAFSNLQIDKGAEPKDFFFARGTPESSVALLTAFRADKKWHNGSQNSREKNAYADLRKLRIVGSKGEVQLRPGEGNKTSSDIIKSRALETDLLIVATHFLFEEPSAPAIDIGEFIDQKFGFKWSTKTKARIGSLLRQWAIWTNPIVDQKFQSAVSDKNTMVSTLRGHDRRRRSSWTNEEEWNYASKLAQEDQTVYQISKVVKPSRGTIHNHYSQLKAGIEFPFRLSPPTDPRVAKRAQKKAAGKSEKK